MAQEFRLTLINDTSTTSSSSTAQDTAAAALLSLFSVDATAVWGRGFNIISIDSVDATGSADGSMCNGVVTLIRAADVFFVDAAAVVIHSFR